jgi:hypothetical protein
MPSYATARWFPLLILYRPLGGFLFVSNLIPYVGTSFVSFIVHFRQFPLTFSYYPLGGILFCFFYPFLYLLLSARRLPFCFSYYPLGGFLFCFFSHPLGGILLFPTNLLITKTTLLPTLARSILFLTDTCNMHPPS